MERKICLLIILSIVSAFSLYAQNELYYYYPESNTLEKINLAMPENDVTVFSFAESLHYIDGKNIYKLNGSGEWEFEFELTDNYTFLTSSDDLMLFLTAGNDFVAFEGETYTAFDNILGLKVQTCLIYEGINIISEDNKFYLADFDFQQLIDEIGIPDNSLYLLSDGASIYIVTDNRLYNLDNTTFNEVCSLPENITITNAFVHMSKITFQGNLNE